MFMPLLSRMLPRTLIAAAVLFAVAAPASAKVVYRWKTDDGVYAYSDDARRIPEKYRAEARTGPLRTLRGYNRYTPAQISGTQAYLKRTQKSAAEMAKLNARVHGARTGGAVGSAYGAPANDGAVLWVGQSGQSTVALQEGLSDSDEPIIIEQKRFYVPGLNSTRTDTIVRQGDRILAVTKPLPHQQDISDIQSESTLPE